MPSNRLWNIDREAYRAITIDETETTHVCSLVQSSHGMRVSLSPNSDRYTIPKTLSFSGNVSKFVIDAHDDLAKVVEDPAEEQEVTILPSLVDEA